MASIGGLDASLCKEASAAFVQTLTAAGPGSSLYHLPPALIGPKPQIQHHRFLPVMLITICSLEGTTAGYMSHIRDWACLRFLCHWSM